MHYTHNVAYATIVTCPSPQGEGFLQSPKGDTKEEESIQDEFGKLIDKIEEWENETIEQQEKVAKQSSQTESDTQIKAIKKAPIQPKMQSKEKSNV